MPIVCAPTAIEGVSLVQSPLYRDDRGYFQELYNQRDFAAAGLPTDWFQDNMSLSAKNVVRGLHYQMERPQAKLVRVLRGAVIDYAVDLRRSSPTFGKHVAVELREGDGKALFIPKGLAHGFVSLEDNTVMSYKVNDIHHTAGERTLLWSDHALGIQWPVSSAEALLSAKDALGKPLSEADYYD